MFGNKKKNSVDNYSKTPTGLGAPMASLRRPANLYISPGPGYLEGSVPNFGNVSPGLFPIG